MMKRYNNLSVYRIIATLCVLLFHVFFILLGREIDYESLLSKGVQGLTALSGFLYSQKAITDIKGFYLKNLKKLLIPAGICLLIMIIWNFVAMFVTNNFNYFDLFVGSRVADGGFLIQFGNFYYIAYIAICYALTPLLQRKDTTPYILLGVAILVEGIICLFFGTAFIVTFYIAAYLIGRQSFSDYAETNEKWKISKFLIWLSITIISFFGFFLAITYKDNLHKYLFFLLTNIPSSALGFASFFLLILPLRFLNRLKMPFLKTIDGICYPLYLMNQTFMCGAMNVTVLASIFSLKALLAIVFTIVFACIVQLITFFINKIMIKRNHNINSRS